MTPEINLTAYSHSVPVEAGHCGVTRKSYAYPLIVYGNDRIRCEYYGVQTRYIHTWELWIHRQYMISPPTYIFRPLGMVDYTWLYTTGCDILLLNRFIQEYCFR